MRSRSPSPRRPSWGPRSLHPLPPDAPSPASTSASSSSARPPAGAPPPPLPRWDRKGGPAGNPNASFSTGPSRWVPVGAGEGVGRGGDRRGTGPIEVEHPRYPPAPPSSYGPHPHPHPYAPDPPSRSTAAAPASAALPSAYLGRLQRPRSPSPPSLARRPRSTSPPPHHHHHHAFNGHPNYHPQHASAQQQQQQQRTRIPSATAALPPFLPQRPDFGPKRKRGAFDGPPGDERERADDRERERGRLSVPPPPSSSAAPQLPGPGSLADQRPLERAADRRDEWDRRRESDQREKDRLELGELRRSGPPGPVSGPKTDRRTLSPVNGRRSPWPDRGPSSAYPPPPPSLSDRPLPPHLAQPPPPPPPPSSSSSHSRYRSASPPPRALAAPQAQPPLNPPAALAAPRSTATRFSSPYPPAHTNGNGNGSRSAYPPPPHLPARFANASNANATPPRSAYGGPPPPPPPPPPLASLANGGREQGPLVRTHAYGPLSQQGPLSAPPSSSTAAAPPGGRARSTSISLDYRTSASPEVGRRRAPLMTQAQQAAAAAAEAGRGAAGGGGGWSPRRRRGSGASDQREWPSSARDRDRRPSVDELPPARKRTPAADQWGAPGNRGARAREGSPTRVGLPPRTVKVEPDDEEGEAHEREEGEADEEVEEGEWAPMPGSGWPKADRAPLPPPLPTTADEKSADRPAPVLPPAQADARPSPPPPVRSTSPPPPPVAAAVATPPSVPPPNAPASSPTTPEDDARAAAGPVAVVHDAADSGPLAEEDVLKIVLDGRPDPPQTDVLPPSSPVPALAPPPAASPVKLEPAPPPPTTAPAAQPSLPVPVGEAPPRNASRSPSLLLQTLLNPGPETAEPLPSAAAAAAPSEAMDVDEPPAVAEAKPLVDALAAAEPASAPMDVDDVPAPTSAVVTTVAGPADDDDADADMSTVSRSSLTQDEVLDLMKTHVVAHTRQAAGALTDGEISLIIGFNACLVDPASSRLPPSRAARARALDPAAAALPLKVPRVVGPPAREAALRAAVVGRVSRALDDERSHVAALRREYRTLDAQWQASCARLDRVTEKRKAKRPAATAAHARTPSAYTPGGLGGLALGGGGGGGGGAGSTPSQALGSAGGGGFDDFRPGRTSRSTRGNYPEQGYFQDVVRSEAEFQSILASLGDADYLDPNLRAARTAAVVPDMLADPVVRDRDAYDDANGLVLDPDAFYEITASADVWTDEEREVFSKKFASHPKQFGKIADALPHKTAAQCVLFYYRHKKTVNFRAIAAARGGSKAGRKGRRAGKASRLMANLEGKQPKKTPGGVEQPLSARNGAAAAADADDSAPPSPRGTDTPTAASAAAAAAAAVAGPSSAASTPSTASKKRKPSAAAVLAASALANGSSTSTSTPSAPARARNGKSLLSNLMNQPATPAADAKKAGPAPTATPTAASRPPPAAAAAPMPAPAAPISS